MDDIKRLKKRFTGIGEVRGFIFTRIRQTDNAFIYEVNTGDGKYYEVFQRRTNRRFACESYPTSRAFGVWAWTTKNLERAEQRFRELSSKRQLSLFN